MTKWRYDNGIASDTRQNQSIELRCMQLKNTVFSFGNVEEVGGSDLADSTFVEPQQLSIAFLFGFQARVDSWCVVAELRQACTSPFYKLRSPMVLT